MNTTQLPIILNGAIGVNSRLQFEAFEVAFEASELQFKLEFALRQITSSEPRQTSSLWQRRLTDLADRLEQLASRLNIEVFSENANAAALSLRECRIKVVESFGLNESFESRPNELQTNNEIQISMAGDWSASEHSEYCAYLKEKVAEILQPFLALLARLPEGLPCELRPFFEFYQMARTIPEDLDRWCDQETADTNQRHDRLLNVIRPELQLLLQRCVSCQPGLSDVIVSYLDIDPDTLEIELRDLRKNVRQVLTDLSTQAAGGEVIHDEADAAVDDPDAVQDPPEAGVDEVEAVQDPPGPPSPVVPVAQGEKVPYIDNDDEGVKIYGIQVEIASDAKRLLMYLCESTGIKKYSDMIKELNAARADPNNTSGGSDAELSEVNIRQIMLKVRRALRTAFKHSSSDPMKVNKAEPKRRFALNREWLATQYERISKGTPPTT